LPAGVKDMIQSGTLSAGHARALLTAPDPEALAKTAMERGLSVRDTERLANVARESRSAAPKSANPGGGGKGKAKHADLLALERDLAERLGLRVTIDSQGASGVLAITYRSIDQLDEILEKLSR
jgi:ParB family chromosome partitioning protein